MARLPSDVASAAADAVTLRADGGYVRLYPDPYPGPDSPAVGLPLAELRLAPQAFYPATDGAALALPIQPDPAARGGGDVGWARVIGRDGSTVFDVRWGTEFTLERRSITPGAFVALDRLTYTQRITE